MPDSGCVPFKVSPIVRLADESEIISWDWDYTDIKGNVIFSTTGFKPDSYTFTDSGRYLVKLRVTTIKGCQRVFSWTVKAGYVPKDFDFDATPKDSCASTSFKFKYLGDSATGFKWFFNGADSVTERDPTKKFKKLGPVSVRLVVYQYGCPKELTKNAFVNVRGVISSFSPLDGCNNPLDRVIVDNSAGNIQTWQINYGDGNTESYNSRRDTIKYSYAKSGQYTVSLRVEGDGCDYIDSIRLNVADERKLDFTLGKTPICVSDTFMNLIAVVDNPKFIKSYNWDLGCDFTGAGSSSALKVNLSSLCKYQSNAGRGMYAMRLRVVDTNNCVITTPVKNVFVGGPIAGYSALSPITGCSNLPVNFKDNTSGDGFNDIISKTWNFGDGTPAQNILSGPVSHVFSSVGSFPVTLTATDASGCTSAKTTITVITSDPDLDFLSFDTASCPDKFIQLEAKSSALLSSYFWKLDDGKTSVAPNPRVSYSITGQKSISLTVKDLLGCEKTIFKPNYLYIDLPSAEFIAEKDTAECPPYDAAFYFKGKFAESYSWDFGDGNTSSLKDPKNLYLLSGNYQVSLTVTSPGGCIATSLKPLTLVVNGPRGTTNFKPTLCEPYNAQFDVSHIKSNYVLIDYGDGNISDTMPVADQFNYVYKDTGLYKPKVFLLNDAGCRVLLPSPNSIRTIAIEPKFTPNINFMCDNGNVIFTDRTSTNEQLISWKWDFGNGKTGTGANPTTYYDKPGFYSVKMNVGSLSGCLDSLTRTSIIEVQARPDIGIQSSKAVICEDDQIQFNAVEITPNNSPVVSWFWDFTNGNSSILQNPILQPFRKAGTYPFRLYVTNSKGCSDTLFQNFIVNANPVVDAGPDLNFCLGTPVKLSAKGASTYQWDPATSISCLNCPDPTINPANDIVYLVRGFSSVGCAATDSVRVKVIRPTKVAAMRDTFVCAGESVQLVSSGTEQYNWSPAGGLNKSDIASPIAKPAQTTLYTVTGKDPYNCFVSTDDVLVRVVDLPKVDAGKDTTVMAGYPFSLRPTYSSDVTKVQWVPSAFLNCATCKVPVSTPSYSTTYTLFAYTDEGCMSKDVLNVFVTCTKENLFIPNTFSPNGDGQNELFYPRGRGIEKIKSMKLFSRWGQLVYEKQNFFANDQSAGWDGRKAGQFVTPDVYVYMIELVCENGNIITLKGDVTLIR
jgi:gliding motility-associated-like protein